jgi:anaerobic selenocysteine-containing dehydrogenase
MAGVAYPDYAHASLIVVWGANPSASGIHILPYIQRARKRGARLVVIDPRRTPLATRADMHIAPRPGTDLPIALSLVRWLFESDRADLEFLAEHATGVEALRRRAAEWSFERAAAEAGVPATDLKRLAELYAESSPAVIRCGWGLERNRNGGSAVAAVLALPAVAGKFGARGGGYTLSNSGVYRLDEEAAIGEPAPPTRVINMNHLGRALLDLRDPPVEILFVYNSNLLATNPNQTKVRRGLEREGLFTVVSEQVMTDTARYADVILPASTFLEHEEISRGYGAYVLQAATPVIEAVGEARPNHDLFTDLLRRLELDRPGDAVTTGSLRERLLRDQDEAVGRRLEEKGVAFPRSGTAPVQFVDAFPLTADGKIHLCPDELDREAPHGLYTFQPDTATPRHPLTLISPATDRTISSTLGELHRGQVALEIHPEDAGARGIADGGEVRVRNEHGEVRCLARHSSALRPGTVLMPKGIWSHNTLSGATGNTLVPDTLTDVGAGACFNDARVQVEPAL